jgi:hypothetical protein
MQELKKLGVMSVARVATLFGLIFGLIAGIYFAGIASLMPASEAAALGALGPMFSWWAVIIMPILYGVMYFIAGIITSVIYNLFAKAVGGIEVDLGAVSKKTKAKK